MHQIQWFPGHMRKSLRLLEEAAGKADVVIEMAEARAPEASRNPLIEEIIRSKKKPRLLLLAKADLADPEITNRWLKWYRERGTPALTLESPRPGEAGRVAAAAKGAVSFVRGGGAPIRRLKVLIAGIPNVGKSTLLNLLAGRVKAKTGNTPGLTRELQTLRVEKKGAGTGTFTQAGELLLFDTPGVLWPRFEDPAAALRLAWLGAIKDSILPLEETARGAAAFLMEAHPQALNQRYRISIPDFPEGGPSPDGLVEEIGRRRGCLVKGGGVDGQKAAGVLIQDLRSGRLGRISFESPP
ncbi:MAG: ribosome biogenesis GTPase YlqF [Spirochaetales bacterium]|jgi:ribosome biogenesis GTPase A|nr:ribosome biogenesis GTPase YlqF [Spirochaetales bacterium]